MRVPRAIRLVLAATVVGGGLAGVPVGEAQAAVLAATLVRTVQTSAWPVPSPDPAGITYDPVSGRLIISDCEVDETPLYAGTNLFLAGLDGSQTPGDPGGTTVPWSYEPTGVGYRPADGRLFVADDDADRIFEVQPGPDGRHGTSDDAVSSFSMRSLDAGDAEDVAVDMEVTSNNHVLVVDGGTKKVYDMGPGPNGVFDGLPVDGGDDTVVELDVGRFGALDPEGVAYHPGRNTVLALDGETERVYELNRQGQLLNIIEIGAASPRKAAGMTLAPASDGSGALHLYIVDRGVDNDSRPDENDGRLYEMSVDLPPVGAPMNGTPRASAGPDVGVSMPFAVALNGWVDDDALPDPPGALTVGWSVVSGPGTVTFADPSALLTSATFSVEGTYVLRLSADDGELQASDDVTVAVYEEGTGVFDVVLSAGTDDAEERSASTSVTGKDLELVTDGATVQTVGLRFPGIWVPHGATISEAHVQFTVDEPSTGPASLVIAGEDADQAAPFGPAAGDITARPRTASAVGWLPSTWKERNDRKSAQRTPDLSPVVQEIVDRPGWTPGNALALVLTGSGTRTAAAAERGSEVAPVLHLEYHSDGPGGTVNAAPSADAGPDVAATMPAAAPLSGAVADDGLPQPPGAVSAAWTVLSGPGPVTFADPAAPVTTATFGAAGNYVLRLTAYDGHLVASDDTAVTVAPEPPPPPPPGVLDVPVAAGSDDAEERSASVALTGTDLELVADGSTVQTVGLRFTGVAVPQGATVTAAYVQFTVDEVSTAPTALTIAGQAADDAATFVNVRWDVSSRPRTQASVAWTPEAWALKGERAAAQRTPDLAPILQEIVARPGWVDGNDLVLVITGSGTRTASASERGPAKTPVLHVEWAP
jgi:hypothetical protein